MDRQIACPRCRFELAAQIGDSMIAHPLLTVAGRDWITRTIDKDRKEIKLKCPGCGEVTTVRT